MFTPQRQKREYIIQLLIVNFMAVFFGAMVILFASDGEFHLLVLPNVGEAVNLYGQYHMIRSAILFGRLQEIGHKYNQVTIKKEEG